MALVLQDLQVELQLMIVDSLLSDDHGIKDEDRYYDEEGNKTPFKDKKRDRMIASHRSILNWSNTCSLFRKLLAPYVFHSITLRNDVMSGSSVCSVAAHEVYSRYVKELEFIGYAPGTNRTNDPKYSDVEGILPRPVEHLLANLSRFPSQEKLSIEFSYDFEDAAEWANEVDTIGTEEDDEEVEERENTEAWRALMMRVWEAISHNRPLLTKHLEIVRLGHKKVSTFSSQSFHQLLANVETFTISLWGGDNGYRWNSIRCEEYTALTSKLDLTFFDHMDSLTSLTLILPGEGMLSIEGTYMYPKAHLPLKKNHLPLLRSLHLEGIFICHALADFITGHFKTLEEVMLPNCYADSYEMHWHQLFDAVSSAIESATEIRLRSLKLSNDTSLPLTSDYDSNVDPWIWVGMNREVEVRKAEEILASDPKRRLFPHSELGLKYGDLNEHRWENLNSFMQGQDQAAWDRLMDLIMKN